MLPTNLKPDETQTQKKERMKINSCFNIKSRAAEKWRSQFHQYFNVISNHIIDAQMAT